MDARPTVDLCCRSAGGARRQFSCQLLVGHEGAHAALVYAAVSRRLVSWPRGATAGDPVTVGKPADAVGRPWAPGQPAAVATTPRLARGAISAASPALAPSADDASAAPPADAVAS